MLSDDPSPAFSTGRSLMTTVVAGAMRRARPPPSTRVPTTTTNAAPGAGSREGDADAQQSEGVGVSPAAHRALDDAGEKGAEGGDSQDGTDNVEVGGPRPSRLWDDAYPDHDAQDDGGQVHEEHRAPPE